MLNKDLGHFCVLYNKSHTGTLGMVTTTYIFNPLIEEWIPEQYEKGLSHPSFYIVYKMHIKISNKRSNQVYVS